MIDTDKFSALLGVCIVPAVIEIIDKDGNESTIEKFYSSKLFEKLQDSETGLWHLSATTLAELYMQEITNGIIEYPEEQS